MGKLNTNVKGLILNSIVGRMHWHGETNADAQSLENMEAAYELALSLINGIYDNATLAPNAVATISGGRLHKRAKDMLESIKEICAEVEL